MPEESATCKVTNVSLLAPSYVYEFYWISTARVEQSSRPIRRSNCVYLAERDSLMKKTLARVQALLFTVLFAAPLAHIHAQTAPAPDPLFQTIQSLDAKLFDAYNHCDLQKFGSLLADDLEFYHDKSGLSSGRQALVEGVKNNICDKVTRELLPGTLEVYPIANYGAVEIGIHRFHHPGHESTESIGEAKFIHLWQN